MKYMYIILKLKRKITTRDVKCFADSNSMINLIFLQS